MGTVHLRARRIYGTSNFAHEWAKLVVNSNQWKTVVLGSTIGTGVITDLDNQSNVNLGRFRPPHGPPQPPPLEANRPLEPRRQMLNKQTPIHNNNNNKGNSRSEKNEMDIDDRIGNETENENENENKNESENESENGNNTTKDIIKIIMEKPYIEYENNLQYTNTINQDTQIIARDNTVYELNNNVVNEGNYIQETPAQP